MERAGKSEATRKMVIAIVAVLALYYFAKFVTPIVSTRFGVDKMLFGIALRSVLALVAFIALGGARWLRPSLKSVGHMWRFMGYLIVLQVLLGVVAFFSNAASMTDAQIDALTPDMLNGNLAYLTILCVLVGINEEVMFRGLFLGGLLARLGDRKSGVIASAVISSLVFGAFHVIGSVDLSNHLSLVQGIMKTLQTGLFGFVLCAPVLEDHNLGGAISYHGFNDWIILLGYVFTGVPESLTTYVVDDSQVAMLAIGMYAVMCVLFLPKAIQAVRRMLKLEEPQLGPFMREETPVAYGAHFK